MNTRCIGELVEITSGQIMSRVTVNTERGEQTIEKKRVIIPKAIVEGLVNSDELPLEELATHVDEHRVVRPGDIVMKLSTPYDAAIITEKEDGCLVPSFCAIIRNGKELDTNYLLAFLNSDLCKESLKMKVVGTVMTILSIGKIKEVCIPVPPMDEQVKIGADYIKIRDNLVLIKQICILEKKKLDMKFIGMVE